MAFSNWIMQQINVFFAILNLMSMQPWAAKKKDKSLMLIWRCHRILSDVAIQCPECRVMPVREIRVTMRWKRRLCIDILEFSLRLRKTRKSSASRKSKGCGSNQRLKWGPLPIMTSVGSHSMAGREGRKNIRMGGHRSHTKLKLSAPIPELN